MNGPEERVDRGRRERKTRRKKGGRRSKDEKINWTKEIT